MPTRLCLDCRTPTTNGTRCTMCTRAKDTARGSSSQRGYGVQHQARLRDPAHVEATHCTTCGDQFTEDNPKTGGHVVDLRTTVSDGTLMPECRRCNYGWRRGQRDT